LVTGFLADPQFALFNASSVQIATNRGWGGTPAMSAARLPGWCVRRLRRKTIS
jgi:hypothetical protein